MTPVECPVHFGPLRMTFACLLSLFRFLLLLLLFLLLILLLFLLLLLLLLLFLLLLCLFLLSPSSSFPVFFFFFFFSSSSFFFLLIGDKALVGMVQGLTGNRVGWPGRTTAALKDLAQGLRRMSTGRRMEVLPTIEDMRAWRARGAPGEVVGLVPTMGALHAGHMALVEAARRECDRVVVSIFVNPTQFAAHEDLGTYPRTMEQDLAMCAAAGVDAIFAPHSPAVMYPRQPAIATVHVAGAELLAEGACRPHFFNAVATVCLKLFNICQPHRVYFGQKDAQQV